LEWLIKRESDSCLDYAGLLQDCTKIWTECLASQDCKRRQHEINKFLLCEQASSTIERTRQPPPPPQAEVIAKQNYSARASSNICTVFYEFNFAIAILQSQLFKRNLQGQFYKYYISSTILQAQFYKYNLPIYTACVGTRK
jgi:hypothetical protein